MLSSPMAAIPEIQIEFIDRQRGSIDVKIPYTGNFDIISKSFLRKVYQDTGIYRIFPKDIFSSGENGAICEQNGLCVLLTGESIVTLIQEPQKRVLSTTWFDKQTDSHHLGFTFPFTESCLITKIPRPIENYYRVSFRLSQTS